MSACHDVAIFSSGAQTYVGSVVSASFVLSGVPTNAQLCLTFDASQIQDVPGTITTSDGLFRRTPLRSIPQLWHDPLSTFTFGEGRVQNMLYMAAPAPAAGDSGSGVAPGGGMGDVMVVLSLMDGGGIEARMIRGAPPAVSADASVSPPGDNLFAVFALTLQPACPFPLFP